MLINGPRRGAVPLVILCAVVCPGRMLWGRVKPNVTNVNSRSQRHAERLDRSIEVLVIKRVFIVPDACRRIRHFVAHEPNAIIARIWFHLDYRCPCPSHDSRLHSHRRCLGTKGERRVDAAYAVPTIGGIVVHVALAWMALAPGIFMRSHILRFGKIGGTRIKRCVQIAIRDKDSV